MSRPWGFVREPARPHRDRGPWPLFGWGGEAAALGFPNEPVGRAPQEFDPLPRGRLPGPLETGHERSKKPESQWITTCGHLWITASGYP